MNLRQCIVADYREYISLNCKDPELKKRLLAHERQPLFFDNLQGQLMRAHKLTRTQIKLVTYDMTQWFLNVAQKKANELIMSHAEKMRQITEDSKKKEREKEMQRQVKTGLVFADEDDEKNFKKEIAEETGARLQDLEDPKTLRRAADTLPQHALHKTD